MAPKSKVIADDLPRGLGSVWMPMKTNGSQQAIKHVAVSLGSGAGPKQEIEIAVVLNDGNQDFVDFSIPQIAASEIAKAILEMIPIETLKSDEWFITFLESIRD